MKETAIFAIELTNNRETMRYPAHVMKKIQANPILKKRYEKEEKARQMKKDKPSSGNESKK